MIFAGRFCNGNGGGQEIIQTWPYFTSCHDQSLENTGTSGLIKPVYKLMGYQQGG